MKVPYKFIIVPERFIVSNWRVLPRLGLAVNLLGNRGSVYRRLPNNYDIIHAYKYYNISNKTTVGIPKEVLKDMIIDKNIIIIV